MNDTTSDFAAYLTQGECIIWQGRNTRTRQSSLLRSMGPALLGMLVALAVAYYIVFVLSPDMVLNIGLGIEPKLGIFLIVLLVFGPFLIRPLWQRRKSKSILLFGIELPLLETVLILVDAIVLVILLWQGMSLSMAVLLAMPAWMMITVEEPQRDLNAGYLVTNLSALIVPTGASRSKRVTIIPLKNLTGIQVVENRDGSGTLMFGTPATGADRAYANSTLAFWNVEKPWEVYQLIRKQIDELTSG